MTIFAPPLGKTGSQFFYYFRANFSGAYGHSVIGRRCKKDFRKIPACVIQVTKNAIDNYYANEPNVDDYDMYDERETVSESGGIMHDMSRKNLGIDIKN